MSDKTAGLKDVAAAAGVSVTTVSRLLNGSLALPDETRKRIEDAIRKLNYRPNPHARRLSRGRSDAIGLVVPDIANPFFATLVAAVEEEADRSGLAVSLFATLNRSDREVAYLELIERKHVDGLIFVTNHADDGNSPGSSTRRKKWSSSTRTCRTPPCRNCSATTSRAAIWPAAISPGTAIATCCSSAATRR